MRDGPVLVEISTQRHPVTSEEEVIRSVDTFHLIRYPVGYNARNRTVEHRNVNVSSGLYFADIHSAAFV